MSECVREREQEIRYICILRNRKEILKNRSKERILGKMCPLDRWHDTNCTRARSLSTE